MGRKYIWKTKTRERETRERRGREAKNLFGGSTEMASAIWVFLFHGWTVPVEMVIVVKLDGDERPADGGWVDHSWLVATAF